ncbi:MAG: hypothetical protein JJE42_05225 [Burkholderiales bacterium]|nr:hypothetical protein [Burkholderiales bacterium]
MTTDQECRKGFRQIHRCARAGVGNIVFEHFRRRRRTGSSTGLSNGGIWESAMSNEEWWDAVRETAKFWTKLKQQQALR